MRPVERVLAKLEGVQRYGDGWRAKCPACEGNSRKVSIAEGRNDMVLLHCFGGCGAAAILESVGLSMPDLFPEPIRPATAEEQAEAKRNAKQAQWGAALDVLTTECIVILLAARDVQDGMNLADADINRVALACSRIEFAALILTERKAWRPDFCYSQESLRRMKRRAADELKRQHIEAERAAQRAEIAIQNKAAA